MSSVSFSFIQISKPDMVTLETRSANWGFSKHVDNAAILHRTMLTNGKRTAIEF